jgi:tetratricopeptide (TPR) repeat protein
VDKSLVRAGNERFVMLEAIREYAYGRLEEHGEADELGRRHFDYFLRVAADAEPRPVSPVHTLRLEGLETEHDNLRIALGRVRAAGDPESVLRLAGALVYFWFVHGHVDEGRRWIEEGLALGHELPADVRAKALHGASFFALLQGDAERAAESAEESLGIWRELDDATGTARALNELAMALQAQGDYEAAGARYAEARELHRGSDHEFGAIVLTLNLASLAHEQGDHGRAQQLFEEALDEAGAHGFHVPRITAQIGRALVSFDLGRTERARADLVEALAACRESGFVDGACDCLDGLAAILTASGETPHAVRLVGAAQELRRPRRVVPDKVIARLERRVLAESSDRLGETAVSALLEEGRALTLDDAVGLVAAVV